MTRRVVRVLSWLVVVGVTALVVAAVIVPRLAGATPYTVLTGSMTPSYPPGTLVVVKPVDIAEVRTGDVVTFQLESGRRSVATHRVVGIGWTGVGEKVLTTQGDANESADAAPVRDVQLRGEVWYSLPWVGRLNVLMSPAQHELLVRLAATALFLYAAGVLVSGRRRRPGTPSEPAVGTAVGGSAEPAAPALPVGPGPVGAGTRRGPARASHRHRAGVAT